MNRRHFLRNTTALAGVVALAACATTPTASGLASDVSLLSSALSAFVTQIQGIQGVPANVVATLTADLATVQADAQAVAAATATAASTPVAQIISTVQSLYTFVAPYVPANLVQVAQALIALLPAIAVAVGLPAPVSASKLSMTPDEARLILRTHGGH